MKKRTIILILILFIVLCIPTSYFIYLKSLRGFVSKNPFKPEDIVYIDEHGNQLFGAQTIDGFDYYLDDTTGFITKGFKDIDGNTFYYDDKGHKITGLTTINNSTYLFEESGSMVKNQYRDITINNKVQRSYFKEDGTMAIGPTEIDGKSVMFSDTGELQINFEELKNGIQEIMNKYGGNIEIYFKDLETDTSFSINKDTLMYPCCMIKPFALAKIFELIDQGLIQYEDYAFYIETMITISDNTSFNKMMKVIGNGDGIKGTRQVNEMCQRHQFYNTSLHHGLRPGNEYFTDGSSNITTPSDFGSLMEKIYKGEIVSRESSDKMIELLKGCTDIEEIKAGLPQDASFAHKTGQAYDLFHDGGIIYTNQKDYILVIFSDKVNYKAMMSEVSAYVYDFMTNNP